MKILFFLFLYFISLTWLCSLIEERIKDERLGYCLFFFVGSFHGMIFYLFLDTL